MHDERSVTPSFSNDVDVDDDMGEEGTEFDLFDFASFFLDLFALLLGVVDADFDVIDEFVVFQISRTVFVGRAFLLIFSLCLFVQMTSPF